MTNYLNAIPTVSELAQLRQQRAAAIKEETLKRQEKAIIAAMIEIVDKNQTVISLNFAIAPELKTILEQKGYVVTIGKEYGSGYETTTVRMPKA